MEMTQKNILTVTFKKIILHTINLKKIKVISKCVLALSLLTPFMTQPQLIKRRRKKLLDILIV